MSIGYKLKTHASRTPALPKPPERTYVFRAKIWVYDGPAAWHFVTLPKSLSQTIRKTFEFAARGWGSLPVEVRIGQTTWRTSIFPDQKAGAYLLPLKSGVRKMENLLGGRTVSVRLTVKP